MKSSVLLLLTTISLCWSCDNGNGGGDITLCDAECIWEFVVKNETNGKEVVISTEYPLGMGYPKLFALAPGKNEAITDVGMWDSCDRQSMMNEFRGGANFHISAKCVAEYPFMMTIDGEAVPDEIWMSKHWSFAPDKSNFYHASYTLTVTDDLIESLSSATGDETE